MHIDVRKYWRTDRALSRPLFGILKSVVFHDSSFKHTSNESDDVRIFDAWFYELDYPLMVKMVKEAFYVCIEYIIGRFILNHGIEFPQCLMTASVRSETHHLIIKHGLKYRFKNTS